MSTCRHVDKTAGFCGFVVCPAAAASRFLWFCGFVLLLLRHVFRGGSAAAASRFRGGLDCRDLRHYLGHYLGHYSGHYLGTIICPNEQVNEAECFSAQGCLFFPSE